MKDKIDEMREILAEYKHKVVEEFAIRLEKRVAKNPDITMAGYQSILADIYRVQKEMEKNDRD